MENKMNRLQVAAVALSFASLACAVIAGANETIQEDEQDRIQEVPYIEKQPDYQYFPNEMA